MMPGGPGMTGGGMGMPGGAYGGGQSVGGGEQIQHFGGITLRVTGNGNLIPVWLTQQVGTTPQPASGPSKQLAPISLPVQPARQPFRLGGFVAQRASLMLITKQIDEVFRVNRIVIWVKPLWTGYPG